MLDDLLAVLDEERTARQLRSVLPSAAVAAPDIMVVGHSLGAGLACLTSLALANTGRAKQLFTITAACPPTLSKDTAAYFRVLRGRSKQLMTLVHMVHYQDPVPLFDPGNEMDHYTDPVIIACPFQSDLPRHRRALAIPRVAPVPSGVLHAHSIQFYKLNLLSFRDSLFLSRALERQHRQHVLMLHYHSSPMPSPTDSPTGRPARRFDSAPLLTPPTLKPSRNTKLSPLSPTEVSVPVTALAVVHEME